MEKDNIPTLLILGATGAAELLKAMHLKQTGSMAFADMATILVALEKAEPRLAGEVAAIVEAVSKNLALEDFCVFRQQESTQPLSSPRAA